MDTRNVTLKEIKRIYFALHNTIQARLDEFSRTWEIGTYEDIFAELVFCILTPQSKATSCWVAVERLRKENLLLQSDPGKIAKELNGVRFKYNKTRYIVGAVKLFTCREKLSIRKKLDNFDSAENARRWLVQNVKGIGYKEASHFLRNIGFGNNFAILDRHIMRNLKLLGVIEKVPISLSSARYLKIERKMRELSRGLRIPMSYLDFVMWYKETGVIFK